MCISCLFFMLFNSKPSCFWSHNHHLVTARCSFDNGEYKKENFFPPFRRRRCPPAASRWPGRAWTLLPTSKRYWKTSGSWGRIWSNQWRQGLKNGHFRQQIELLFISHPVKTGVLYDTNTWMTNGVKSIHRLLVWRRFITLNKSNLDLLPTWTESLLTSR